MMLHGLCMFFMASARDGTIMLEFIGDSQGCCIICVWIHMIQTYGCVAAENGDTSFQYQNEGTDLQWEYFGV